MAVMFQKAPRIADGSAQLLPHELARLSPNSLAALGELKYPSGRHGLDHAVDEALVGPVRRPVPDIERRA